MIIHMIAERPTDRLKWQYQLNQYKGKQDFVLSSTIPRISGLDPETVSAEDVLLILLNRLDGLSEIKDARKNLQDSVNVVALISKECELDYGRAEIEKQFRRASVGFGAVYYEMQSSAEDLYRCLFKPRNVSFKPEGLMEAEAETVFIDRAERAAKETNDEPVAKLHKRLTETGRRGFGFWGEGKKKNLKWLEKQPRLRLCIHGESALTYELGAVLSSLSGQSVLVMDLDRMSPTADIYCGVKPVVKEKYDFYAKATATGLNILLDCMKKSALSREVFRLCTQQPKGYSNLHILTGVYKLEDYEYYKSEDLKNLVDSASAYYDVILMKTNSFPYDGFTLNGFLMADAILWGGKAAIESVRYNRQLIQLMEGKQKIPMEKQLWTLFERSSMEGLEKNFLVEMGLGTYCGSIPYCRAREKCLSVGEGYLDRNRRDLEEVYWPVIKKIYKGGC